MKTRISLHTCSDPSLISSAKAAVSFLSDEITPFLCPTLKKLKVHIAFHYENTPIQIYMYIENFTTKNESFQIKILIFFYIPAQNIDCGYSLEYPREAVLTSAHNLFLSRNKTNNVYPCKPQFYYIKCGLRQGRGGGVVSK